MFKGNLVHHRASRVAGFSALLFIASLMMSLVAHAQSDARVFEIPVQPMDSALTQFAVEADQQVLFSADLVKGHQAKAVSGRYTPTQALTLLLSGSGLTYEVTSSNVLMVKPVADPPPEPAHNPAPGPQSRQVVPISAVETVISTARKREEPLQETPAASTVLSGQALEVQFANDLKDMSFAAPNVNIARLGGFSGYATFFIRGIGDDRPDSTVAPPVALFVDGVYLPRPNNTALDMFDVESVEILRGPQGTLFGRNTSAGAIQIRTRRPSGEFGVRGKVTVGDYGLLELRAAVDVPIVQGKVDAKVAVLASQFDGYYKNTFHPGEKLGGENTLNFRPMIRFRPNDHLTWTLIGEYIDNDVGQSPAINASTPPQLLCTAWGYCGQTRVPRSKFSKDAFNVSSDLGQDDVMHNKIWGITSELVWNVGPGEITWISNYRKTKSFFLLEVDPTSAPMWSTTRDEPHNQQSTELRFASTAWDSFDFVAGVYALRQKFSLTREIFLQATPAAAQSHLLAYTEQTHKVVSVFGEGNYHVTDRLTLTAGGRYTWEKKSFIQEPPGAYPNTAGHLEPDPKTWTDFGPKAGINYKITDEAMAYFTYSRGFRSGGWNGQASTPTSIGPFDPESVNAYEFGLKSDWFDKRLRANLALFLDDYKNLQRTIVRYLPNAVNPQEVVTENAAGASIKGVELELSAVPVEGLQLNASLSYLDAKYSDFCADLDGPTFYDSAPTSSCGGPGVNVTNPGSTGPGNYLLSEDHSNIPLQRAPAWQLTAGVTYEFPLGNLGYLQLNGRYTYVSNLNVTLDGMAEGERGSVNLVDASITFKDVDGRYSIAFYGKNLTNEIYLNSLTRVATLLTSYAVSEPRTWGIEISWDL
ncbi:MAG: TonB-dependent receptor [Alphaproteobacteria bacterium]|nr:TonB-dependent receptor [Alphaproteobacteria bacterium]